jgi:hypothetical protein
MSFMLNFGEGSLKDWRAYATAPRKSSKTTSLPAAFPMRASFRAGRFLRTSFAIVLLTELDLICRKLRDRLSQLANS